ncbi:MAG: hypothetical protein KDD02_06240 [Phaeodactylibacter sp.]|nr:hypothetical protein [Phaeodactylibacter sp.]
MHKNIPHLLLFGLLSLLWLGCGKDEVKPAPEPLTKGVFVTNEGLFNQGNASVTFYNQETGFQEAGLFQSANGRPLGDILQSMTIVGDLAYLVLNNSQRIEIVDLESFESAGAIEGLGAPRYFLPVSDETAYVSDLFGGIIHVVSLTERKVVQTIPMPENWTEAMVKIGSEVFVACPSSWGAPPSDQLYIIDTETHSLVDSIAIGLNANALVVDKAGKLWVLCAGDSDSSTPGGLYQVDPDSRTVIKSLPFEDINIGFAPRLAANPAGDTLYYTKIGLFALATEDATLPAQPLVSANGREFYGLGVEPATGNIWVGDAKDFQSRGEALSFSPSGLQLATFDAGYLPNGFAFK